MPVGDVKELMGAIQSLQVLKITHETLKSELEVRISKVRGVIIVMFLNLYMFFMRFVYKFLYTVKILAHDHDLGYLCHNNVQFL